MNRRRFLTGIIATIAAPAIVRAEWLMPVSTRPFGSGKYYWEMDIEPAHPVGEIRCQPTATQWPQQVA